MERRNMQLTDITVTLTLNKRNLWDLMHAVEFYIDEKRPDSEENMQRFNLILHQLYGFIGTPEEMDYRRKRKEKANGSD